MKFKRLRFTNRWLANRDFGAWVRNIAEFFARPISPYLTANQVTLIGLLACIPMTVLYMQDYYILALFFLVFSSFTDLIDGALAHYQQADAKPISFEDEMKLSWRQRIGIRGISHLGKELDPFRDKVCFFCVLFGLGIGAVANWLIYALTLVGVVLTALRPIKRHFGLGDASANRFGKFKFLAENLGMILLISFPKSTMLLNMTFAFVLMLALASVSGHLLSAYVVLRSRKKMRILKSKNRRFRVVRQENDPL